MAFGEIGLQSQGLISVEARFFAARRHWVGSMVQPALHHGETSKSQGKVWIELDSLFEKRLGFERCIAKHVRPVGVIVRPDEEQIGVRILGWPAIETCFFIWRKLCLKSRDDFLREIGLNGEYVG